MRTYMLCLAADRLSKSDTRYRHLGNICWPQRNASEVCLHVGISGERSSCPWSLCGASTWNEEPLKSSLEALSRERKVVLRRKSWRVSYKISLFSLASCDRMLKWHHCQTLFSSKCMPMWCIRKLQHRQYTWSIPNTIGDLTLIIKVFPFNLSLVTEPLNGHVKYIYYIIAFPENTVAFPRNDLFSPIPFDFWSSNMFSSWRWPQLPTRR